MPSMQEMIQQKEMERRHAEQKAREAELQARQKRQQTLSTPAKLYGNANMYDKASNWLASSPNQTISNIGTKMSQFSPVRMGKQAIGDMVNKVTGGIQNKLPVMSVSQVEPGILNAGSIMPQASTGGSAVLGTNAGVLAPEAGTMASTLGAGAGEGAGALSGAIGANVAGTAGTAGAESLGAIGGAAGSSIGGASAGAGAGAGALAGGAGAALGAVAAPLAIAALVGSMIHQKNVEKASKEAQIGQQINQEADAKSTNEAMQNIANAPTKTQQKLMDTANQTLAQTQQPQLPTDIAGMQQYMRDNNYSDEAINGLTQGLNYGDPTIDNWIKGYNEQNPNAMINIPQGDEQIALAKEGKFNTPKEEGIADKVSGIMGQLKQGFNEGITDTGLNKLGMVGGKVYDVLSNPAVQGAIAGLAYAKDSGDKLYGLRKGIEWAGNKSTSDYYDKMMGRRPGILPGMSVDDYKAQQKVLMDNLGYQLDLDKFGHTVMNDAIKNDLSNKKYELDSKKLEETANYHRGMIGAMNGRNAAINAGNTARSNSQKYWQDKANKESEIERDVDDVVSAYNSSDPNAEAMEQGFYVKYRNTPYYAAAVKAAKRIRK
jgi:hypothetical protein